MLCASVDDEQVWFFYCFLQISLTLSTDRICPCRDKKSGENDPAKTKPKLGISSQHRKRRIHTTVRWFNYSLVLYEAWETMDGNKNCYKSDQWEVSNSTGMDLRSLLGVRTCCEIKGWDIVQVLTSRCAVLLQRQRGFPKGPLYFHIESLFKKNLALRCHADRNLGSPGWQPLKL